MKFRVYNTKETIGLYILAYRLMVIFNDDITMQNYKNNLEYLLDKNMTSYQIFSLVEQCRIKDRGLYWLLLYDEVKYYGLLIFKDMLENKRELNEKNIITETKYKMLFTSSLRAVLDGMQLEKQIEENEECF